MLLTNKGSSDTVKVKRPVKNAENQYTLIQVGNRYFVSYPNGEHKKEKTEVSRDVFLQLEEWRKEDTRNEWNDRHNIEQSELTEESIHRRSSQHYESIDEQLIREEQVKLIEAEFLALSETQQERILLVLEDKKLVEIAKLQGCKYQSIQDAFEVIRKKFRKYL